MDEMDGWMVDPLVVSAVVERGIAGEGEGERVGEQGRAREREKGNEPRENEGH